MATAPIFAATPKHPACNVTTANTALDGTGSPVTLVTAGSGGARYEKVVVKALVTTTAGMIRIFTSIDAGTSKYLRTEIPVTAITKSATVAAFETEKVFPYGLVLAASEIVYATTEKSESMIVRLESGGDY